MAPAKVPTFAFTALRVLLFAALSLQWISGVIVLGISVHFMAKFQQTKHMKYYTIISSINTWMYGVGQCFAIIKLYKGYGTFLHLGFSYLWLAAFIFATQDYNYGNCANTEPPEAGQCGLKYTLEAFAFLAYLFSFISIPLEALLFVEEHYKTPATLTVAPTTENHMATHALTEKKEEERIENKPSLDDPESEISAAPTVEQQHAMEGKMNNTSAKVEA